MSGPETINTSVVPPYRVLLCRNFPGLRGHATQHPAEVQNFAPVSPDKNGVLVIKNTAMSTDGHLATLKIFCHLFGIMAALAVRAGLSEIQKAR